MASVFYGRTVSRTGDKRRRGVILGCERNWRKWMGGVFYFDMTMELPAVTRERSMRDPLASRDSTCALHAPARTFSWGAPMMAHGRKSSG